ncbi:hypothetical protein BDV32DRAFT_152220 [Aspergillus pseudonomiae]|uniref:Uncharacterized protein n=1 Tax=Aspergillus pseudonomiae TaxID=1506151 RepID=A0A5N7D8X4_9EURO|nr:uncharacterized protein BDV37DRAFT_284228 [Aspergillus pseudonomiae]KAB8257632.1 hypothetical protein BDV32DRAFT_152220 [Aspergillus pseudonomiae]KAE8402902.1 hypothetical protein BDV37DRAFT_284228 [Aspergillus pseudonomiae]
MLLNLNTPQKALLWLFIQAAVLPPTIARQCYWRNGASTLNEQQPCFPDKADSPCCATNKQNGDSNDVCTTTGLCVAQVEPYTGLVLQNGCTDSSWKSSSCLNICPGSMKPDYGIHILPCPDKSLKHWCCSLNGSDCCDSAFELDMGTLMLSSNSTSPSSLAAASATVTATTTATVTAGTGTDSSTCNGDCHAESTTIAVGAGVGAGLGACLVATVCLLVFQRRAYQKKFHEMKASQSGAYPHVQQYGPFVPKSPVELPLNQRPTVFEIDSERPARPE